MKKRHVATAAEAIAAAQLARCGWDVSVRYGIVQSDHDLPTSEDDDHLKHHRRGQGRRSGLMATKGNQILEASVKGSSSDQWGLAASFVERGNVDYHLSADRWKEKYKNESAIILVSFGNVELHTLPRMYIATPHEICEWLKAAAAGRGDSILYEYHEWSDRAFAKGTIDRIPAEWRFSEQRLVELAVQISN